MTGTIVRIATFRLSMTRRDRPGRRCLFIFMIGALALVTTRATAQQVQAGDLTSAQEYAGGPWVQGVWCHVPNVDNSQNANGDLYAFPLDRAPCKPKRQPVGSGGSGGSGGVTAAHIAFIGVPLTTGALASLVAWASKDSNQHTDEERMKAAQTGFLVGAVGGEVLVLGAVGLTKLTKASRPAGLGLLGGLLGAGTMTLNQMSRNADKTAEQEKTDDKSGKTAKEYKSAALKGAGIGTAGGVAAGLITEKLAEFNVMPRFIRTNRWLGRASVSSSTSITGTTQVRVVVR